MNNYKYLITITFHGHTISSDMNIKADTIDEAEEIARDSLHEILEISYECINEEMLDC